MTLRLQINLIVGTLMLAFLAVMIGLQFRSQRAAVQEEVVAANRVASQLLQRTAWLHAAQGIPEMRSFLQGLGRLRSNDISLLDLQGRPLYQSPPSTYKTGRDAPDWFAALISPAPSAQSIAFPDGRLVVRANASRAALDAWDELRLLGAAALAGLLLAQGLVAWLVGRAVRPFARIVAALEAMQAGRRDVVLPALPGREAAAIGAAFNRMTRELQAQLATERRALRAELALSDSRALRRDIEQHIEQERRLIARELHDELGQSVTAMRSMALSVAQRVAAVDPGSAEAARLVADECGRLYDAMHGIIPRLAPLVLDSLGLAAALDDLVQRTRRSQPDIGLDCSVTLPAGPPLSPEQALTLYRAAQEGLTNALRHGRGSRLQLRVWVDGIDGDETAPQQLRLQLDDDGLGLQPQPQDRDGRSGTAQDALAPAGAATRGHHGLRWLAERVHSLGGMLALLPRQPRGASLQLQIPLDGGAPEPTP